MVAGAGRTPDAPVAGASTVVPGRAMTVEPGGATTVPSVTSGSSGESGFLATGMYLKHSSKQESVSKNTIKYTGTAKNGTAGATREEVQRHENLKITLIFDCMIVLGAEFYVPNGA